MAVVELERTKQELRNIYMPEKTLAYLMTRGELFSDGVIYEENLRRWLGDNFPIISLLAHAIHEQVIAERQPPQLDPMDEHSAGYGKPVNLDREVSPGYFCGD